MRTVRALLLSLAIGVSASAALAQEADLLVTKDGPAEAAAGSDVAYTVAVTNLGPDAASGVTLDDPIPAGMTFVSATQNDGPLFVCSTPAVGDPGNVTCTAATLPAGSTATFTFVFHIPSGTAAGTTFTNFATVSSLTFDPNEENNAAPASTTVPLPPQTDVAVSKLAAGPAGAGADLPFTITITNAGANAAENLTLTDTLPGDLTFVSLDQSGTFLSCTTPAIGAGGTITCTAATYPAGATTTLTLTGHVPSGTPSGTTYTNTAVVTADNDANDENDAATVSVTVSEVDLSVTKEGPATANAGEEIDYTITVTNGGPDFVEAVELTDVLPPATTFVAIDSADGATCTATEDTVHCSIPSLAPGASTVYTLTLLIGDTTSITNTASVSSSSFDPDTTDNSDSATTSVTPSADLTVTKSGPATALIGGTITYGITVANNGPSEAASVTLTDTIPPNTTFVSFAQTGGPAFDCTTGATVTCTIAALADDAAATFELVVRVDQTAAGSVANTAAVSTTTNDPVANNESTTTATLSASADVSVTKSGPATATAGENVTYTIGVANAGPTDAANVSLNDTLPAGTTFVSLTQTAGPAFNCTTGATVTCTIATLADDASATFELVVSVDPSASGSLSNAAAVSTTTADPSSANNESTTTATLSGSADLAITKSGPATATAGADVTWSLVVANNGPSDAANVSLTDMLPANTTFVSLTQTAGPAFNCTTGATVTCTTATLADGAVATFELVANIDPSATGSLSNTASISSATADPAAENNESTATSTLAAEADLSVTKSGPASATAGENITYTIAVANGGPSNALNVTLSDTLPANTTFVSLAQTSGPAFDCTTGATVTCTTGTFVDGASATFELVASIAPSATGAVSNTATVSSSTTDVTSTNNSSTSTASLGGSADLSASKSGPATAIAGDTVTYAIGVANAGPSDAAAVSLTDTLPANATFVSLTQTGGPAFNCTTGATVTCTIATLASGTSATFELIVDVASSATGTLSNTATVSAATSDPNGGNNSGTTTAPIASSADVTVTKSGPAAIVAGTDVTWSIAVSNAGPSDATNVTLTDVLPAGTTFVSLTQTAGPAFTCTTAATVTCTIGTLTAGSGATFTLVTSVASSASGTLSNTATVAATTADPAPANNTSTATAAVTASADLSAAKVGPATATAGETILYTIDIANAGPSDAANATLTDTIPSNTTFVSLNQTAGGAPFTCTTPAPGATGTITCTAAVLADLQTASFELVVTVAPSASGAVSNTATITSATSDPNAANNSSTTSTASAADADLAVTKSGPASAIPGGEIVYTIELTNAGPSNAANVTLTDVLPPNTTFVSLTQTAGPTFSCTTGPTVTCTIASLAVTTAAFELRVAVSESATGAIANTASATSTTTDPTPANSASTATATIETADVTITKASSTPTAALGAAITYTIVVTNQGPDPASGVTVTDTLPEGVTLLSAASTQGTCNGATTITCAVGTLAAGASATITLEVELPQTTGAVTNTASVTADQADPLIANNADSTTVLVVISTVAAIPTLSEWMLIALALGLAGVAVVRRI